MFLKKKNKKRKVFGPLQSTGSYAEEEERSFFFNLGSGLRVCGDGRWKVSRVRRGEGGGEIFVPVALRLALRKCKEGERGGENREVSALAQWYGRAGHTSSIFALFWHTWVQKLKKKIREPVR